VDIANVASRAHRHAFDFVLLDACCPLSRLCCHVSAKGKSKLPVMLTNWSKVTSRDSSFGQIQVATPPAAPDTVACHFSCCLMHYCCSLPSLIDPDNGGACHCIFLQSTGFVLCFLSLRIQSYTSGSSVQLATCMGTCFLSIRTLEFTWYLEYSQYCYPLHYSSTLLEIV
jgi:hypothetical protein